MCLLRTKCNHLKNLCVSFPCFGQFTFSLDFSSAWFKLLVNTFFDLSLPGPFVSRFFYKFIHSFSLPLDKRVQSWFLVWTSWKSVTFTVPETSKTCYLLQNETHTCDVHLVLWHLFLFFSLKVSFVTASKATLGERKVFSYWTESIVRSCLFSFIFSLSRCASFPWPVIDCLAIQLQWYITKSATLKFRQLLLML